MQNGIPATRPAHRRAHLTAMFGMAYDYLRSLQEAADRARETWPFCVFKEEVA